MLLSRTSKIALISLALVLSMPLAAAPKTPVNQSSAAQRATAAYPGKVLKVTRKGDQFIVKMLLDNGRVRNVVVDAKTGKVH